MYIEKKISTRLLSLIFAALVNMIQSFSGAVGKKEIGDSVFIVLTVAGLATALSMTYWERNQQVGLSNEKKVSFIILLASVAALFLLSVLSRVDLRLSVIIFFIPYIAFNNSAQLLIASIASDNKKSFTFELCLVRLVVFLFANILFYSLKKSSVESFVFLNFIAALIFYFYLKIRASSGKNFLIEDYGFVRKTLDVGCFFLVLMDFLKSQLWVVFCSYFEYSVNLAFIFLLRQILSPFAMVLAAYRSVVFDRFIKEKRELRLNELGLLKIYTKIFIALVILISCVNYFVNLSFEIILIFIAWVLIVLFQDYRGYINRLIRIDRSSSVVLIVASFLISGLVALFSMFIFRLNIGFLLLSLVVSEAIVLAYFKSTNR